MFTTPRRQPPRGRSPLITWFAMVMMLLSLTPAATFAMAGLPAGDVAQTAQGEGQFLEVHLSTCPPGTNPESGSLYDDCHDNGTAGVDITVTGPNGTLDKTTVRVNDAGPGIINTGDVPAGEYTFAADIPTATNAFSVYCSERGNDTRVPATPDNRNTATVTVPDGTSIVCDLYVIPQQDAADETGATLDLDVRSCERGDLPSDARTWDDLSEHCTDLPVDPVEFTLVKPDGSQEQERTNPAALDNAAGDVTFDDLPNGDYGLYSDVPFDEGADYLFCEYTGQPRYQKEFNPDGVTTFSDLDGEEIACDWFVVYAPAQAEPTATTAPTATTEPTATAAPTEPPAPTATTAPEPEQGEAYIAIDARTCPADYEGSAYAADCVTPANNVLFTLAGTSGGPIEIVTADDGSVVFSDLVPDTYTLYSDVPLGTAHEVLTCMPANGVEYGKEFNEQGVTTFQDVDTEQLDCDWYILPESQRGEETGATVTVHLATCPEEYAGDALYADCHGNGVADMDFTLTGPEGEMTAITTIPATPGPGVATFTKLPAGDYTLAGGPPQDFGTVSLYCSDPATGERIDSPMEGGIATFHLNEQQSILCDWYFIPENASGIVTPTPVPEKAEILVTLFECGEGVATAGATFAELDANCTTPVNDITVSLGAPGGLPISAETGVSGDGAVRFYDLRPSDYVMTPNLPADYTSAAVFCQIGDGDVYQKPLQNGSTTFVNVEGEQIACSWFLAAAPKPQPQPAGPAGSITVREFLCEKDRGDINDWERECVPGTTGTAFTLASSDGAVKRNATPDDKGVLVFGELPDGYYELTQDSGVWCRAAAERVDSRSRVIVQDGGNTDVFLYQCNQVLNLPSTGTGTGADVTMLKDVSFLLAALALPLFGAAFWRAWQVRPEQVRVRAERGPDHAAIRQDGNRIRIR